MVRPCLEVFCVSEWVVEVCVPQELVRKSYEPPSYRTGWEYPKDSTAAALFVL